MDDGFNRLVDALPGLVWTASPDGRVEFVSQRWREYTGLSPVQIVWHGWKCAFHPDDLEKVRSAWRTVVASEQAGEVEARLRRADGEYRLFLIRACPVRDETGRIARWCGINTDIEDRARAQEELRQRESHFRSVFDGLPALVTLMTPDGALDLANRHTLEFFGANLEDLKSRPKGASFHPEDFPRVLAAWRISQATGDSYDVEARQRRVDGVYRWMRIQGFPLRDPASRLVNWYFLQTDVDDARRAQAQLAGEKHILELVAAGRPLAEILDSLCRLVEAATPGRHCGILFPGPGGETWQTAVGPELPSGYNEAMHGRPAHRFAGPCGLAARQKGPVVVSDVQSDPRWIKHGWRELALAHGIRSCWSAPILAQDQCALGALAIYSDQPGEPGAFEQDLLRRAAQIASIAVERARAEEALTRSEALLLDAQRLTSTASFIWRPWTGRITWSEEACRIFELPAAELNLALTRTHPEDRAGLDDVRAQAGQGPADLWHEYRLQMPDGRVKYVQFVTHGALRDDGELEYIGTIQDVTERRASEEALEKVRAELAHVTRVMSLGVLAASIAHEVNQPLSGITINAETSLGLLATDPPSLEQASEVIRRIVRDAERAAEVIGRLRALFARRPISFQPFALNEAAREVIALARGAIQRNRVRLRVDLALDIPPVLGDRVQLQQVILNLVLNGCEAMSGVETRPRRLVIRTERNGVPCVRLSVQDTGVGLAPDALEALFEPFHSTKSGGMGIGLSVSRSIIENHHGRLWATANDGPGATFAFEIPCLAEGAAIEDSARPESAEDAGPVGAGGG